MGALDLEMEMTGTAGVERGHDSVEPPASLSISELMSAQAEPGTVIVAVFVGMPDLDEGPRERPAASVEDEARNRYPFTVESIRVELPIARRVRPEERTGLPLQSGVMLIATFEGQRK